MRAASADNDAVLAAVAAAPSSPPSLPQVRAGQARASRDDARRPGGLGRHARSPGSSPGAAAPAPVAPTGSAARPSRAATPFYQRALSFVPLIGGAQPAQAPASAPVASVVPESADQHHRAAAAPPRRRACGRRGSTSRPPPMRASRARADGRAARHCPRAWRNATCIGFVGSLFLRRGGPDPRGFCLVSGRAAEKLVLAEIRTWPASLWRKRGDTPRGFGHAELTMAFDLRPIFGCRHCPVAQRPRRRRAGFRSAEPQGRAASLRCRRAITWIDAAISIKGVTDYNFRGISQTRSQARRPGLGRAAVLRQPVLCRRLRLECRPRHQPGRRDRFLRRHPAEVRSRDLRFRRDPVLLSQREAVYRPARRALDPEEHRLHRGGRQGLLQLRGQAAPSAPTSSMPGTGSAPAPTRTYASVTAKYNLPFLEGLAVSGEFGHYWLGTTNLEHLLPDAGDHLPDYNYWNVGVSYTYKNLTADVRYHDTNLSKTRVLRADRRSARHHLRLGPLAAGAAPPWSPRCPSTSRRAASASSRRSNFAQGPLTI